MNKYKFVDIIW